MLSESGGLVWPKNVSLGRGADSVSPGTPGWDGNCDGCPWGKPRALVGWPSFIWNGPCNYLWGELKLENPYPQPLLCPGSQVGNETGPSGPMERTVICAPGSTHLNSLFFWTTEASRRCVDQTRGSHPCWPRDLMEKVRRDPSRPPEGQVHKDGRKRYPHRGGKRGGDGGRLIRTPVLLLSPLHAQSLRSEGALQGAGV